MVTIAAYVIIFAVSLHAVENDPSTSQEELVKSIEAIQVK